jgi:CheY-like chemotaxis protein
VAYNFLPKWTRPKSIIIAASGRRANHLRTSKNVTTEGYQVIKAKNSKEAITFAEAKGPDLIFMDLNLLDADGIKTTTTLKQNPKTSRIPVVALTAWMAELWREKASKVGIVSYMLKPISPQTLKETIEEYTRGSLTRNPLSPHKHSCLL